MRLSLSAPAHRQHQRTRVGFRLGKPAACTAYRRLYAVHMQQALASATCPHRTDTKQLQQSAPLRLRSPLPSHARTPHPPSASPATSLGRCTGAATSRSRCRRCPAALRPLTSASMGPSMHDAPGARRTMARPKSSPRRVQSRPGGMGTARAAAALVLGPAPSPSSRLPYSDSRRVTRPSGVRWSRRSRRLTSWRVRKRWGRYRWGEQGGIQRHCGVLRCLVAGYATQRQILQPWRRAVRLSGMRLVRDAVGGNAVRAGCQLRVTENAVAMQPRSHYGPCVAPKRSPTLTCSAISLRVDRCAASRAAVAGSRMRCSVAFCASTWAYGREVRKGVGTGGIRDKGPRRGACWQRTASHLIQCAATWACGRGCTDAGMDR